MKLQLRLYTIESGNLESFITAWRETLVPLRERFGFRVLGAYTVPEANLFVWFMAHDSPETWDEADGAYFASAERLALRPDPARFILHMENRFVEPVAFGVPQAIISGSSSP